MATDTPISNAVESLAASFVERAGPYLSPFLEGAKGRLPTQVIERVETAYASGQSTAHSLLESADGAVHAAAEKLSELRKTPDLVKAKAVEGTEFVQAKVAGLGFPTSYAELKTVSGEQLAHLKAALAKLSASLPSIKLGEVIPEEQVERVRAAVGKVLESLPKLPHFEMPKMDLAAYTPHELVKFGQQLLEKLSPFVAPYQERVQKLLTDYKVQERAAGVQKQAVDLYKAYNLEKVTPAFVNAYITGPAPAPVVAVAN